MADLSVELANLNVNARELFQIYDDAFARLENLSEEKRNEIIALAQEKLQELQKAGGKLQSSIDEKLQEFSQTGTVANALKLSGKSLEEIKEELQVNFLNQSPQLAVKTYSYGLRMLRDPINADNIDNLFQQFKAIENVWIYSEYQNYTSPKVNFNYADASHFKFDRTTVWCTKSKKIEGTNGAVVLGWSNRGSTCYKGYYIYVTVNKTSTGLIHACDCGNCPIYENQIYVNGNKKCLGNKSTSSDYDVTIFVEGVLR